MIYRQASIVNVAHAIQKDAERDPAVRETRRQRADFGVLRIALAETHKHLVDPIAPAQHVDWASRHKARRSPFLSPARLQFGEHALDLGKLGDIAIADRAAVR